MEITSIREAGSNDLLKWAIANNADIKDDIQLQSLINDETFYQITIDDVNFFELFRLTQCYRDKLRMVEEKRAAVPTVDSLKTIFPGDFESSDDEDDDDKLSNAESVSFICQKMLSLALQMKADSDIIRTESVRLFIPMIARKFKIQIPVNFYDVVSMISENTASALFNMEYPDNLNSVLIETSKDFINAMYCELVKMTSVIRYNDHYDDLLKIVKFSQLKSADDSRLYKFAMVGFSKYDSISRSEVICNLFKSTSSRVFAKMKQMSKLKTPLKVSFAVMMPIQYMQILENYFNNEELKISYESSIKSLISDGFYFNDFISEEFDENDEKIIEYRNSIETYKNRIDEANTMMLNTIGILATNPDIDATSTFSILPSIYMTKAVITLDMSYADMYVNHYDAVIVDMFQQMLDAGASIINDFSKLN